MAFLLHFGFFLLILYLKNVLSCLDGKFPILLLGSLFSDSRNLFYILYLFSYILYVFIFIFRLTSTVDGKKQQTFFSS